jgi:subtilisin family serine protease
VLLHAIGEADLDCFVIRHLGPQLSPQLDRAVVEVGASHDQLPVPTDAPAYDGKDVIVGVVDYGCDFAHPNLRHPGGSSRLLWIWDMNPVREEAPPHSPPPLPPIHIPPLPPVRWPGRGLERAAIDAALHSTGAPPNYVHPDDRPYYLLGYHPHDNYYASEVKGGAHGTHVLDVAGGNGLATHTEERFRIGVAPGADLAFVQVPKPQTMGGRRLFAPWSVVLGVAAIFKAGEDAGRPAVVNVSLNGTGGPHDGQAPFDQALDWLSRRRAGQAIVVGAGNFFEDRRHARGVVRAHSPIRLTWRFAAKDTHWSEMEIWYDVPNVHPGMLKVVLTTPWGGRVEVPPRPPGVEPVPVVRNGRVVGGITNCDSDPLLLQPRRRHIHLWIEPHERNSEPAAGEDWLVGLEVANPDPRSVPIPFNAWIARDDESEVAFGAGCAEPEQTLGTLACCREAVVVGAYSFVTNNRVACHFSSAGPTRDDREVPDIAAPGRGVWAAKSTGYRIRYPGSGSRWRKAATFVMDGTSTAAPFVAGTVALMLQKNPRLTSDEIKAILRYAARDHEGLPQDVTIWDQQLGVGLLSASEAVDDTP